jgi:phage shock protein C
MYCTSCGNALKEDDRYCSQCGRSTTTGAPAPPVSARRLVRPIHKKKIAGVCAGFADYLGVDLTLMRIIWLCAALFTGVGFLAYLVCWIVMPKEYPEATPAAAAQAPRPETAA